MQQKILFSFIFFALSIPFLTLCAQSGNNSTTLDSFHAVYVYGDVSLDLVPAPPGGESGLQIRDAVTGFRLDDLDVRVEEDVLYIRTDANWVKDISLRLSLVYAEPLFALRAANGARIYTRESLLTDDLSISAFNGGNMEIDVEANSIDVKVLAGSVILIAGEVQRQTISVRGGGTYDALKMESEESELTAVTGGIARIQSTSSVSGKVSLNAYALVQGNPAVHSLKTRLGGMVDYEP